MAKKNKLPVAVAMDTVESRDSDRRWKAENGLRTIQEAAKIQKDKGLMKDIKALANEQVSNLKKFCK